MTTRFHTLKSVATEDGTIELRSTGVGLVRGLPEVGAVLGEAATVGALETLGEVVAIVVPGGAGGRVVARHVPPVARAPVGFGTRLLTLDPSATSATMTSPQAAASASTGLVFASPMSGRFYVRPSPSKPALVEAGQVVAIGQAVCLIEVMKTFNRVAYAGTGLPPRARVARMLVADGEDVTTGQPLFAIESVE